MGKFFDLDSPLMRFLTRMADLMWLNILTLFFVLVPFTGGASLTAMHYVLLKMVRDEESYITKSYFKSFKENFKQATILWIIVCAVVLLLGLDIRFVLKSGTMPVAYVYILFAISAILYMIGLYIFPLQSKFVNPVIRTLKNSVLISILGLPRTVGMVAATAIPILLLYFLDVRVIPLILLFGISGPGYLRAMLYNKLFKRFEPEDETEHLTEEEELNAAIRKLDEMPESGSVQEEVSETNKTE